MAAKNYTVRTRDVDGASARHFATLPAAVRRFEEMAGVTVAAAIAECFHELEQDGKPLPTVEQLSSVRAVSMFGSVVVLEAVSPEAIARAAAARAAATAAAAPLDWAAVVEVPIYGSRDELTGRGRQILAGPFATEEQAAAALSAALGDHDDTDPDYSYFVARVSEGLRRRPAPVTADDGSHDLPF